MFREVPLLKIGVILMALVLALVIAAAVVSLTLGSEPERLLPAEVAKMSPEGAPRTSSVQEGSLTKNFSSEKKSSPYPSREKESPGYSPSTSAEEPVVQRKEQTNEPQSVLQKEQEQAHPHILGPRCPNRQEGKHLPRHPQSPNHNNPTNKGNPCLALNEGTGPSPPKES